MLGPGLSKKVSDAQKQKEEEEEGRHGDRHSQSYVGNWDETTVTGTTERTEN